MTRKIAIVSSAALVLGSSAGVFAEGTSQEAKSNSTNATSQVAPNGQQQQGQQGMQSSETSTRQAAPPAMNRSDVSPEQGREVQRRLHAAGHYEGNIDGIVGPQTTTAIRDFQRTNQLPVTGTLTPETANALGVGYEPIDPGARQPVAGSDRQPNEVQSAAGRASAPAQQDDGSSVALSDVDEASVTVLPQKLQDLGFYKGSIDGIAGPMTRAALTRFYNDQARLAASGRLTESTADMLGVDISVSAFGSERGGNQTEERLPPSSDMPSPPSAPSPGEKF
jgi:peptidoglycan hydrolase-like protein with peptidoglycan-binding domain